MHWPKLVLPPRSHPQYFPPERHELDPGLMRNLFHCSRCAPWASGDSVTEVWSCACWPSDEGRGPTTGHRREVHSILGLLQGGAAVRGGGYNWDTWITIFHTHIYTSDPFKVSFWHEDHEKRLNLDLDWTICRKTRVRVEQFGDDSVFSIKIRTWFLLKIKLSSWQPFRSEVYLRPLQSKSNVNMEDLIYQRRISRDGEDEWAISEPWAPET